MRHADAGYSLEESLRRGISWGALFGNLIPYVEVNSSTAVGGIPGGTAASLRPGILWMGKYAQVSVAADIPLPASGFQPRHVGAVIQLDWFLDEIFPPFGWTPFGRHARDH